MSGCRFVPEPLGLEVGDELGGVRAAHPVVGVRAVDTVLLMLERLLSRLRRVDHSRHRTPPRRPGARIAPLTALILMAVAALLAAGATPSSAADSPKSRFTVAFTGEVDNLNPFLGVEANSYEMW